ncbi:hypothetical protein NHX12_032529 [Muraenolepis orangiensis]|uniref:LITAF domain-containing protein n=1 Tax=Muraenolepis orangiensis TaxID=630683 RepID=A0A9Q0E946_9TELE|nr:hypothetical protein NHX12_032529 [Muraenolepis orangiensis]
MGADRTSTHGTLTLMRQEVRDAMVYCGVSVYHLHAPFNYGGSGDEGAVHNTNAAQGTQPPASSLHWSSREAPGDPSNLHSFSTSHTIQLLSHICSFMRFVSPDSDLGRSAGMTTCTSCQQQVMSNVTYKAGTYAWLMCLLFICCGLVLCCCLIPFFLKNFKDAYHTCPRCNKVLHVDKKKCCS